MFLGEEVTAGRVADAVDRQVEDGGLAADLVTGDRRGMVLYTATFDLLEHRGEDHGLHGRVGGVVLVGVDADGPDVAAAVRAASAASNTPPPEPPAAA